MQHVTWSCKVDPFELHWGLQEYIVCRVLFLHLIIDCKCLKEEAGLLYFGADKRKSISQCTAKACKRNVFLNFKHLQFLHFLCSCPAMVCIESDRKQANRLFSRDRTQITS